MLEAIWEWWDEEGKFRERVGELIWRVGMQEFLKVIGQKADVRMVYAPRNNPFIFWRELQE